MSYVSGGLIEAADYNGFVSNNVNNVNQVWSTGSTDLGWGQTALSNVSVGAVVTATNWASLVNTLSSMGSHTGTTITSRTAPVTGNLIQVLANLNTDITNIKTNRGNAAASGTTSSTWIGTTSKTTTTGTGNSAWSIQWSHTINFFSPGAARYFFNAGGLIRLDMSKTSTGLDSDPDWNTFIGTIGTLYLSGRVNGAAQTIAGTSYTGFTRIGGSGTPNVLASTTGWYNLPTSPTLPVALFQQFNSASPYTNDYVGVQAVASADRSQLTFTTLWVAGSRTGAGQNTQISGGTNTTSPFSTFGTAPTVLCRLVPPSTTWLTNSWGTPTVTVGII
jgi:hypothetical protein